RFLFAAWQSNWETRTDHDHRAILAALRKGEVDLACATLARHVRWIGRRPAPSTSGKPDAFAIHG
ncbi:FCD domain-containing protein, partial [Paracoccus sp. PXZ]